MGGDGPPRGGARGGRDQFDWEAVKADKDREFYLGASVKALKGRWQNGRDVYWWTKDKAGGPGGAGGVAAELAAVKAEEERLMQEALGLRPVTERRGAAGGLDANELKELLKRTKAEEGGAGGAGGAEEDPSAEATRVKGVGYSKHGDLPGASGGAALRETLPGLGPVAAAAAERDAGRGGQAGGAAGGAAPPPPEGGARKRRHGSRSSSSSSSSSSRGSGRDARREKKERKRAKKEAKRAKKEAKRARKERERGRSRSRSRSRERGARDERARR